MTHEIPLNEMAKAFLQKGWARFPYDNDLRHWLKHAKPEALKAVRDPANAQWLRCGGTWFSGVNILPNDPSGAVGASGPLTGVAVRQLEYLDLPIDRWDRGQISVIYPGYPRPNPQESDAAFRFRRDRDAAHVDGLLPVGPSRRRMLREAHAFVLSLPMSVVDREASPLVVWEGSHEIVRLAIRQELEIHPPESWANVDITDAYHSARCEVFEKCKRKRVFAKPGEAYLIHRLALHGVAPWGKLATAAPEGRMIAYFRPQFQGPVTDWLNKP